VRFAAAARSDTGRKLRWDAEKEEIVGDPEANRHLGRVARKEGNWV
jgi:hypothetical protein